MEDSTTATSFLFIGAAALDTILSLPRYPAEDSKLRAISRHTRAGGNAVNALTAIAEIGKAEAMAAPSSLHHRRGALHFLGPLGDVSHPSTNTITSHLHRSSISHTLCPHRPSQTCMESYITRSLETRSRTIVTVPGPEEMTEEELVEGWRGFFGAEIGVGGSSTHETSIVVHIEGRNVDPCGALVRAVAAYRGSQARGRGGPRVLLSAEFEKPDRVELEGWLPFLDFVFISSLWVDARMGEVGRGVDGGWEAGSNAREDPDTDDRGTRSRTYLSALALSGKCRDGTLLITTRGALGAFWTRCNSLQDGNVTVRHAPPTDSSAVVVDTVGAGDTFIGAVLSRVGLWAGGGGGLDGDDEEVSRIVGFGVDMATAKCGQEGVVGLAVRVEVAEVVRRHGRR